MERAETDGRHQQNLAYSPPTIYSYQSGSLTHANNSRDLTPDDDDPADSQSSSAQDPACSRWAPGGAPPGLVTRTSFLRSQPCKTGVHACPEHRGRAPRL